MNTNKKTKNIKQNKEISNSGNSITLDALKAADPNNKHTPNISQHNPGK